LVLFFKKEQTFPATRDTKTNAGGIAPPA